MIHATVGINVQFQGNKNNWIRKGRKEQNGSIVENN
jgi:hypothetical protein